MSADSCEDALQELECLLWKMQDSLIRLRDISSQYTFFRRELKAGFSRDGQTNPAVSAKLYINQVSYCSFAG
jgi:hypothetical protein